jgi:hypothetical protein
MPNKRPLISPAFFLLPAVALLLLWAACNKSDFANAGFADHNSEFAFPLFTTDIVLKDLMQKVLNDSLKNDALILNPDQTMTLYYTGDVAKKPATDIFKFFDGGYFPLTGPVTTNPVPAPNGVVIYEADLKSGQIGFTIANSYPDTVRGTITIPQMTKNGEVFTYHFKIVPGSPSYWPQSVSLPIDVQGYVLKSTNNSLTIDYDAKADDGNAVVFPFAFASFNQLKFSYLQGFWGFSYYPLTRDTIDININQTSLNGNVKIKNPKVTMLISNSWGFPTRGTIKYLSFLKKDGTELKLITKNVFLNDTIQDFNYPSFAAGEIGKTKYTYVTLDDTNSNIADIFNAQPTRFIYEVNGISNANNDPSIIGFMTDSSIIKLSMRVELLLEGSAQNFGADQKLDLNFGSYSEIDTSKIESVEFKLVTENATPISSKMQILFEDAAGNTIDSLFSDGPKFVIEAAPVDAQGVAQGVQRKENFIRMSTSRFEKIRKTKRAELKTAFTTANDGTVPVKLLANEKIVVKMGLKVKTKL